MPTRVAVGLSHVLPQYLVISLTEARGCRHTGLSCTSNFPPLDCRLFEDIVSSVVLSDHSVTVYTGGKGEKKGGGERGGRKEGRQKRRKEGRKDGWMGGRKEGNNLTC